MNERTVIYLHLIIAFIAFPLQRSLGPEFQFVMMPYVFYLVWSRNPLFLPALFVLFAAASTSSYVILLTTFFVTAVNIPVLCKMGLRWLGCLALFPAPILIWQTSQRALALELGVVEILTPLPYYLGLFPFFYGVLIAPRVKQEVLNGLYVSLFLLPFLELLPNQVSTIRAFWMSFPLFFALLGAKLCLRGRLDLKMRGLLLSPVLLVLSVVGVLQLSFTLVLSGIVAVFAVCASRNRWRKALGIIAQPKVIILFVALMLVILETRSRYSVLQPDTPVAAKEVSRSEWRELLLFLKYKAFDDRARIWAGGWSRIVEDKLLWPPYEAPAFSYISSRGRQVEGVVFGVHNIGLELMRNYGIIFGAMLALVFLLMLIKGPGEFLLQGCVNNSALLLAATCLGTGLGGGLVGQYVLTVNFSFLLMSLSGIFYSTAYRHKSEAGCYREDRED